MAKLITDGAKAPAFDLPTNGGGRAKLSDYRGKALVLYFYPKDDTSGCTKEAIEFSAALKKFANAGAQILGVSKDAPASHDKFRDKYALKLRLASDETGKALEAYGVWVEKSMYGRKYMGIERATFLIDGAGEVLRVWRKVRVPGHVEEVLDAVKGLD